MISIMKEYQIEVVGNGQIIQSIMIKHIIIGPQVNLITIMIVLKQDQGGQIIGMIYLVVG